LQTRFEPTRGVLRESIHGTILKILSNSNRPMHVEEITKKVLQKRRTHSAYPNKTISSILQKSSFVKRYDSGYKIVKKPEFLN